MCATAQDEEFLYLVMDYIPGGDMMSLLMKWSRKRPRAPIVSAAPARPSCLRAGSGIAEEAAAAAYRALALTLRVPSQHAGVTC